MFELPYKKCTMDITVCYLCVGKRIWQAKPLSESMFNVYYYQKLKNNKAIKYEDSEGGQNQGATDPDPGILVGPVV